ncbi:kinetochore component CENP-S-domain-containing protein [Immersiella caudata]|uniref:Kinetochore component CENP-S-domain-containing protein n=1 Tax=Immersiella caudata TaxID=314043 RepID=A0AA40C6Q6_9PEZI|nr:kinetochore component CENP-S-domain-containing protein [Immersiella caudata]
MAEIPEEERRERLKAALWFSVGKIVDEESVRKNRNATPQFIGALTEMLWTQLENIAIDLESFSNHAGRTNISTDDVLLLARRNEDLYAMIKDTVEKLKAQKQRKRKRG